VRVLVFGTYDVSTHPRVGILAEGLRRHGADVEECNAPLGIDTAGRVALLSQPWRLPLLLFRLARRWATLTRRARRMARPDVLLVGYLGHFDVQLARRLFPHTPIVLDHLIGAADTARDRGVTGGLKQRLLRFLDAAALRAADVVVVDTEEHREIVPARFGHKVVVVPVGAPDAWFTTAGKPTRREDRPLRVVFFGLFTPLQGAPVIGRALAALSDQAIEATMVGHGQDLEETRIAALGNDQVRWLDWAPSADLPRIVADHDVCLGVFGTSDKALRVVPNKVFQGAAAGCAIVTSDSPPQRRVLGDAAVLVPPGDAEALAKALLTLAEDRAELDRLRAAAGRLARDRFIPPRVVEPLLARLEDVRN
jgi:glycosyltransferase involved in cell wall biosynthesis